MRVSRKIGNIWIQFFIRDHFNGFLEVTVDDLVSRVPRMPRTKCKGAPGTKAERGLRPTSPGHVAFTGSALPDPVRLSQMSLLYVSINGIVTAGAAIEFVD